MSKGIGDSSKLYVIVPSIFDIASPNKGPPTILTLVVSISESGSESLFKTLIIRELGVLPSTNIESFSTIGQSFS